MRVTTELFGAISINEILAHFCFPEFLSGHPIELILIGCIIISLLISVILICLLILWPLGCLCPLISPLQIRPWLFLNLFSDSLHPFANRIPPPTSTTIILLLLLLSGLILVLPGPASNRLALSGMTAAVRVLGRLVVSGELGGVGRGESLGLGGVEGGERRSQVGRLLLRMRLLVILLIIHFGFYIIIKFGFKST